MSDDAVKQGYAAHGNPYGARALDALGAGVAVSARGATLRTSDGRELVDLASSGFGYGHPKVLARVAEQLKRQPLSCRVFFSVPLARLVERLAQLCPGDLQISFFGAAGAEAVEGALKIVRGYHRDRTKVVAAVGAYHGATTGALSVCGIEPLRRLVGRLPIDGTFVPYGDGAAMERAIDGRTAAVIIEPVLAGTGVKVPPPGYLKTIADRCAATGALFVADEITTGLGRTGRRFGVDHDGVVPDLMVLAGALGGGVLPIGGYVAKAAVNNRVYDKQDPLLHANTTGGNPSACTAALAALEVIEEEDLAGAAAKSGARIGAAFEGFRQRFGEEVREHAVSGLLAGLRLRDADCAHAVQRAAVERGALVRVDGLASGEAWIGLRPPLLISTAELDRGLEALGAALERTLARPAAAATAGVAGS